MSGASAISCAELLSASTVNPSHSRGENPTARVIAPGALVLVDAIDERYGANMYAERV
jgi:hypothetical protein